MKKLISVLFVIILICSVKAQTEEPKPEKCCSSDKLAVLWTTDTKDVFTKVVFPYCFNAEKNSWWQDVTLIVWGPSSKLLASDKELQEMIGKLKEVGVNVKACLWCADQYSVTEKLKSLGIDVKYMGKPLTEFIKKDKVIVF